ncbi:MAG: endonuclease [Chitinophagaceae bacterium]|nr:MAG: endonuclease [Chitinophagaceae bacterium]
MPEGPSILHLKDELMPFKGKIVKKAGGYGPMPTAWIKGKKLLNIETWGKHLLFIFANGAVKVHLGLFGDVVINERKKVNRSFYLEFAQGEINGYVVSASKLKKSVEETYDWRTDILSNHFDKKYVKTLLKEKATATIDDVLMDQDIFTGVGNKIRNEALYRAAIHPQSIVGKIPAVKITKLVNEVVNYAKIFYKQLRTTGVNDFFQVYQLEYAADGSEVTMKVLPKTKRKVFFSEHRQKLYK